MVQKVDVLNHVPGDEKGVSKRYTHTTLYMGWRPRSAKNNMLEFPSLVRHLGSVNAWRDTHGTKQRCLRPRSKTNTHTTLSIKIVPCVYLLDSFLVSWIVAEGVGVLYFVSLSMLSPTPRALPCWKLMSMFGQCSKEPGPGRRGEDKTQCQFYQVSAHANLFQRLCVWPGWGSDFAAAFFFAVYLLCFCFSFFSSSSRPRWPLKSAVFRRGRQLWPGVGSLPLASGHCPRSRANAPTRVLGHCPKCRVIALGVGPPNRTPILAPILVSVLSYVTL